jgi:hypothetical protein
MNATFSPSASRFTHHRSAAQGWRRGDRCRALKRALGARRVLATVRSPSTSLNFFNKRSPVGMEHGQEASRTCRPAAGLGTADTVPVSRRRGVLDVPDVPKIVKDGEGIACCAS